MMTSKSDKDLSRSICSVLDNFGFKKENVAARSRHSEEMAKKANCKAVEVLVEYQIRMIPVGSSAEGIAFSNSDMDFMIVGNEIICLDQGDESEYLTIFETAYTNTAPGYTMVICTNINEVLLLTSFDKFEHKSMPNYPYVSSAKFRDSQYQFISNRVNTATFTLNGPAVTTSTQSKDSCWEGDFVYAVYFYGSDNLQKWANRMRLHNWPSGDIVKEISEIEGYIVPVGYKQSENQNLEWRICYTTAEKELVSSLSDIQIKLYVLLKLVAKSVLKPVFKALTSYVVKNVVFWIMEGTYPEQLQPDNLVVLLLKSLHFIKSWFENNHLPNYMIPERNLLKGTVFGEEKQNVMNLLSDCLTEGGTVILRVPKLYQCVSHLVTNLETLQLYGKWRNAVENQQHVLLLQKVDLFDSNNCLNGTDFIYKCFEGHTKLFLTVVPDLLSLSSEGKSKKEIAEIFKSRLRAIKYF